MVSHSARNPNEALLLEAAIKLSPMLDRIAFVGGCATGMLVTDPGAAPVRPTLDVDVITEITSYADFVVLEEKMSRLGFHRPEGTGAPVCRWTRGKLTVDVMPTDPAILGFSNRWYGPALRNARRVSIGEIGIPLITAPYFLATKLEALHGRGRNDFRLSRDLEDIVAVLDGRAEIVAEVSESELDLRDYLRREFSALRSNREFMEALPGHLLPDAISQQRLTLVVSRLEQIAGSK